MCFWNDNEIGWVPMLDLFRRIPIFFQGFLYYPERYPRLLLCLSGRLIFGRGRKEARYPAVEVSADFG